MARRRCGRSRGLQWVNIATIAAAVLCSRALDPDALKLNTGPRQVHPNLSFCTTNVSYTEYPEAAEAVIPQTLTGAVALEELMAPVRIQSYAARARIVVPHITVVLRTHHLAGTHSSPKPFVISCISGRPSL